MSGYKILKTDQGTFFLALTDYTHFGIDCICNGTNGIFKGHLILNTHHILEEASNHSASYHKEYDPLTHTFYLNCSILELTLALEHKESESKNPMEIICLDCNRKFSFTYESYNDLIERIKKGVS